MLQPEHAETHKHEAEQQHTTASNQITIRSNTGDERTENQSTDKTADVSGIVGAPPDRSKNEVVARKHHHTAQRPRDRRPRKREFSEIKRRNQRAGNSEDRSGGSYACGPGMPDGTGHARRNSGGEIDCGKRPMPVKRLRQSSQIPEAPQVKRNMEDATVNKHARDQSPPLPSQSKRAKIRAPISQFLGAWLDERNAREGHRYKHDDVDGEESLRHHHRAGFAAQPGRRLNALNCVFFAALRRFMLHTP